MDFVAFTLVQWKFFILILFRVGGILATAPFYGSPLFPAQARIAFALVLALILFPVLPKDPATLPTTLGSYFLVVFSEVAVGIVYGAAAALIFAGVQLAGQMMDHQ
ncbi:MAG: flagellar biosynthetic protein FliR, partial [Planctomycetes bacterium]|nr:flagellar biosynthetic protein FliR [Planctomycetota bacterium]